MTPAQQLAKAISLASSLFVDKVDKGGEPYILHCLRVMNNLHTRDKELQAIAVLHDVVEDTHVKIPDLRALGYSERVIDAVQHLTHYDPLPYMDYIKIISMNKDARLVKMADLKDNFRIDRLKGLTQKDLDRMAKYQYAYTYLAEQ